MSWQNEIEKMRRYIELTGVKEEDYDKYEIRTNALNALRHMSFDDLIGSFALAFEYGRAKGERHARKEQWKNG